MIRRILIENFQSIESLNLELGQITVFRGENRQGKSAVLRAIRALITNPRGHRDIRSKARSCSVFVETEKGTVGYEKERAGSASYVIQLPGREPILKKKVTEVPREVFEVVNIGDIGIDEDLSVSLNYSSQLEPHFLLTPLWGTSTAVAKVIGKVTNVDKLSSAARMCATDLRTSKIDLGETLEKIRELEQMEPTSRMVETEVALAEQLQKVEGSVYELERALSANSFEQFTSLEKDRALAESKLSLIEQVPFDSLPLLVQSMESFIRLHQTITLIDQVSSELQDCKSEIALSSQRLELANAALCSFVEKQKVCPICEKPWSVEEVHI